MKPLLTIFTPLYNRKSFLPKLYGSLKAQTYKNFEWIVVDDGSNDQPIEFFSSISNSPFPITFISQQNGGKHRAINQGVKLAKGEWFLILDSDDWLTKDAVEIINKRINDIQANLSFASICGLRVDPDYRVIGTPCNYKVLDTTFFDYRFRFKIKGDRAEIVRTSVMKEFLFHEFNDENFMGEAVLWNSISKKYMTRFTDDKFYICDYQIGGLTDTFEKRMMDNPYGSMLNQLSIINFPNCPYLYRLLSIHLYFKYYKLATIKYKSKHLPLILSPSKKMKKERCISIFVYWGLKLRNHLMQIFKH